jgi:hypothetical protein
MQNLINYIKNSSVLFTLNLNPFYWIKSPFYSHLETKSDMDPGMKLDLVIKVLFLKMVVFIDDGRW